MPLLEEYSPSILCLPAVNISTGPQNFKLMHKEDTPAEVAIENCKYNKLKYGIFLFTLDGKFIRREDAPSQTFWHSVSMSSFKARGGTRKLSIYKSKVYGSNRKIVSPCFQRKFLRHIHIK